RLVGIGLAGPGLRPGQRRPKRRPYEKCNKIESVRNGSRLGCGDGAQSVFATAACRLRKSTSSAIDAKSATNSNPATEANQAKTDRKDGGWPKRAKGAAGGAVGGPGAGNPAAGAVIGAGHGRRQQRRDNRHQ